MDANYFNLDGPVMSGNWYNPNNGDSFTVRDCFFEDNNYIITTTDGRRLDFNHVSDYIKYEGSKPPVNKAKDHAAARVNESLPAEVLAELDNDSSSSDMSYGITPEDLDMINGVNRRVVEAPVKAPARSTNYDVIEKAMSKVSKPKIQLSIKWDNYPEREISMLHDILDVPLKEISEFVLKDLKDSIGADLEDAFDKFVRSKVTSSRAVEEKPKAQAKTKKANK